jgi:hypothetical protein
MNDITVAVGLKDNIVEDIHTLAGKWFTNPEILLVTGKEIKQTVTENASALFIPENLVLVLLDPERELIEEIRGNLEALKEKIHIIIYSTTGLPDGQRPMDGNVVRPEQDTKKRIEERVRSFIRRYEKKMTDQAFQLLKARIRDTRIGIDEARQLCG